MAKVSMKNREAKRAKLVQRYAAKREALKAIVNDPNAEPEAKWDAQLQQSCRAIPLGAPASLPDYRSSARLLPEVRFEPYQAARSGDARRRPRSG